MKVNSYSNRCQVCKSNEDVERIFVRGVEHGKGENYLSVRLCAKHVQALLNAIKKELNL